MIVAEKFRIDGGDSAVGEGRRGLLTTGIQVVQQADPVADIQQSIRIGIRCFEAPGNRILAKDSTDQQDGVCKSHALNPIGISSNELGFTNIQLTILIDVLCRILEVADVRNVITIAVHL